MPQAVWTPKARLDLEEILFQIQVGSDRPLVAEQIGKAIQVEANVRSSLDIPGQSHPLAPQGWLYFRFKRWLIFYQPHSEGIEILRVIDGARDLPGQFRLVDE